MRCILVLWDVYVENIYVFVILYSLIVQILWGYWLERNTSYLFYMQRKPWTCVIISRMQFFSFFSTYFPSFNVFDILFHLISKLFQLLHEISYLKWALQIHVSQIHNVKRMRVLAQGLLRCIKLAKLWKWIHFQRMKSWDSLLLQQVVLLWPSGSLVLGPTYPPFHI